MQQYNITEIRIGRNIGTEPMTAERWSHFQANAVAVLEFFRYGIGSAESWTEVHLGTGSWTAADGSTVVEESAVVTLYASPRRRGHLTVARAAEILHINAADIAARFGQDAVAVVRGGRSTLVKSVAVAS